MSEVFISHDGEPPIAELEPLPVYDSIRGQQVQRRWVGSPARIKAKYEEILLTNPQTIRISEALNNMGLQLTADYAGVFNSGTGSIDTALSVVVTEWTSQPAVFTKDIWTLPVVAAELDKLGKDDEGLAKMRLLRNYIDALVRGDPTIPDPADPKGVKTLPLNTPTLLAAISLAGLSVEVFRQFIFDLYRGTNTYSPASWTLRRSRRIPAVSAFTESSANVGRMLTYGALASEGFTASVLRTALPTHGYWHKQHPTDQPVGDGFREVVTEYWWGEDYSRFIYGAPITA